MPDMNHPNPIHNKESSDSSPRFPAPGPISSNATEPDEAGGITPPPIPEPVSRPRIWPALVVGVLSLPASWLVAGVVMVVAAVGLYGFDTMQSSDWLRQFSQSRLGLLVMVIPGQLVFLGACLGAAALSPEKLCPRLALCRGVLPSWSWVLFMLATPVVGFCSSLLLFQVFDEPSEHLLMMAEMMRTHARGGFLLVLLLLIGVLPGVVEELLFRGYLQSRLLRRWHPVAAIFVSTLVFAAAHLDPIHVLGVIPLGIWLGIVAWRAHSVWPAMLCHLFNNVVAVFASIRGDPDDFEMTFDPMTISILAMSLPAMLLSTVVLARRSGRYRN